jgi:deoxyribose-phosphate aldolase
MNDFVLLEKIKSGYTPAPAELAILIDHTLLKPDATSAEVNNLCEEAIKYNFKSVCIPPSYVEFTKQKLKNTEVLTISVVGFPFGYTFSYCKLEEGKRLKESGADELDMVINITYVKRKLWKDLQDEITSIKSIGKPLKVIVETCYLEKEEKIKMAEIVAEAKADFIKTSTGFGPSGANIEDIKLFKNVLKDTVKIKASGGIRDYNTAISMLTAGASRLGLSASVKIVNEKV